MDWLIAAKSIVSLTPLVFFASDIVVIRANGV